MALTTWHDFTAGSNFMAEVPGDVGINTDLLRTKWADSTEPASDNRVAYQDWVDTTTATPIWKLRDKANAAWVDGPSVAYDWGLMHYRNVIAIDSSVTRTFDKACKFTDGVTDIWVVGTTTDPTP